MVIAVAEDWSTVHRCSDPSYYGMLLFVATFSRRTVHRCSDPSYSGMLLFVATSSRRTWVVWIFSPQECGGCTAPIRSSSGFAVLLSTQEWKKGAACYIAIRIIAVLHNAIISFLLTSYSWFYVWELADIALTIVLQCGHGLCQYRQHCRYDRQRPSSPDDINDLCLSNMGFFKNFAELQALQ